MPKKPVILPGLSYIPDPVLVQEKASLHRKLSIEFIDFLDCVTDLLGLMQHIKVKHLRTMQPIPFEVIREIRRCEVTGLKIRTHMSIFEKNLKNSSIGISPSVEQLLGGAPKPKVANIARRRSTFIDVRPGGLRPKKQTTEDEQTLSALRGGKRAPPLWHQLAREKHVTTAMVQEQRMKSEQAAVRDMMKGPHSMNKKASEVNKQELPERQPKDNFSLKFATDRRGRQPPQAQKDIMEANSKGFATVASYRSYIGALQPFWYTALIKNSIQTGLRQSPELCAAFQRLSKFFEVNCASILQSRAKLCCLLHSLPVWDVGRTNMQRAALFVLGDILLVPDPSCQLKAWITARRLPYCLYPPVLADNFHKDSLEESNKKTPSTLNL